MYFSLIFSKFLCSRKWIISFQTFKAVAHDVTTWRFETFREAVWILISLLWWMFNFAPILKNYKLLFNIRVNYLFPRLADFLHSFMLWTILLPDTDSQIFVNIVDYQFTWLNFEIQLEICYTCSWACDEFLPTFF